MGEYRWNQYLVVLGLGLVIACGGSSVSDPDASPDVDAACDCGTDEVCRYETCVPTPTPCTTTDDCSGDFYCDVNESECLPYGVGPGAANDNTCTRDLVQGVFLPELLCEWTGPPMGDSYPNHTNVLSSPVVANVGGTEFGTPIIAFIAYNHDDGGDESCRGSDSSNYFGVIRIIDGRSCEQLATIDSQKIVAASSLAIADLDGTGSPEIIAAIVEDDSGWENGGLAAWRKDGSNWVEHWVSTTRPANGQCIWAGPSVHDLDDDGVPEVLFYGSVFSNAGVHLGAVSGGDLNFYPANDSPGYIPVAADIDGDGAVELMTGSRIFEWNATSDAWELPGGVNDVINFGADVHAQTAVADLGTYVENMANDDRSTLDGVAEIIVVDNGNVRAYAYWQTGSREIFSAAIPPAAGAGNYGGAPTVADFDGDGRAEFASAGATQYAVFDLDCTGTPDMSTCGSLTTTGILWSQPSQDSSSNRTGSSVFDFEGDGTSEVVYGDECFTRIYDGPTGEVWYSRYRTSCTWYENPIIADTDAQAGAEILITSNTNCGTSCPAIDPLFDGIRCFDDLDCASTSSCERENPADEIGRCRCTLDEDCGGDGFVCADPIAGPSVAGKVCRAGHPGPSTAFGIRVISERFDRWVDTRDIWNQHAYSITNVGDNGTIPSTSSWQANWQQQGLNSFRQNSLAFGGVGVMPDLTVRDASFTCPASAMAELTIEVCNRGTVAVAAGMEISAFDSGSALACTAVTQAELTAGTCASTTCNYAAPTSGGETLTIAVDDDGTGDGRYTECREDNNDFTLASVVCP